MNKFSKITFIPGWLDSPKFYNDLEGIDLWKEDAAENLKIKTPYILAHSLGCNFALMNWQHNRDCQLILVNPVLGTNKFWITLKRWWIYFWKEGRKIGSWERKIFCLRFPLLIGKFRRLTKIRFEKLLDGVPREKIMLVKGEKDEFFSPKIEMDKLKNNGYMTFQVPNLGHNFSKKGRKIQKDFKILLENLIIE